MAMPDEFGAVSVLFEDDHLVVTVKPAGMPTANAPPGRPSLFGWLKSRLGPNAFVGVVSRLDAAVSGLVVFAKTPRSAARLSEQFRNRTVEKLYVAVVTGRFPAAVGTWLEWTDWLQRPEGPGPTHVASKASANAQKATTKACVNQRGGEVSLVELSPLTGRRHQLRVQLSARGCPIVGDRLYGSRLPFPVPGGIALHATQIAVEHPDSHALLTFQAPTPQLWRLRFPHLFPKA